ncbi:nucleoporin Nup43 [Cloeon dipterum]|uniref:nucleoporin Nup43 n=1 Tax=Cloeon dipterum TaxID=197152 RepID=UPI00321FDE05
MMLSEVERLNLNNVSRMPQHGGKSWKKIGFHSGKKTSKVRFLPSKTKHDNDVGVFLSATYEEENNELCMWSVDPMAQFEESGEKLNLKCSLNCEFDCVDMKISDSGRVFLCWSDGSCGMFTVYPTLQPSFTWQNLHRSGGQLHCACRGVDVMGEDVVTVGDDGKLILLNSYNQTPIKSIDASSVGLTSVCFSKHNEVVTGNSRGQIAFWDLRSEGGKPTGVLCLSRLRGEKTVHPTANSQEKHPTRTHLLLSGGSDGCVTLWDLRNAKFPVEFERTHTGPVLEAHFHPEMQECIVSCSSSGDAFLWDCSLPSTPSTFNPIANDQDAWSSVGRAHHPQVTTLLPKVTETSVTSLALSHNMIVCSKDPGFLFVYKKQLN